jgi:hypothetical protein
MLVAKQVADFITYGRAMLGVVLVWLGAAFGREALPTAAVIMLINWSGDVLDGLLARLSSIKYRTWIGDHDLEVDMFVAGGLFIFLITAGYLPLNAGFIYLIAWLLIFWRFGFDRNLGMLIQAPAYLALILISLRDASVYGLMIVLWIAFVLIATWPRFPQEVIPGFLTGMQALTKRGDGGRG